MRIYNIQQIIISILKMAGFSRAKSPKKPTRPHTVALGTDNAGVWKKEEITIHLSRLILPESEILFARFEDDSGVVYENTIASDSLIEEEIMPLHAVQCREMHDLLAGADIEIGFYRLGYEVGAGDHHPAIRYDDKIRVKDLYADSSIKELQVDEEEIHEKFTPLSLWEGTMPDPTKYEGFAEDQVKEAA